jgi:hypothetical protein
MGRYDDSYLADFTNPTRKALVLIMGSGQDREISAVLFLYPISSCRTGIGMNVFQR